MSECCLAEVFIIFDFVHAKVTQNMPKVDQSPNQCYTCKRFFKTLRSLTLHEYHSRSCGLQNAHHALHPPLQVQDSPSGISQSSSNDNENNNLNPLDDDESELSIAPFELSPDTLEALPGEQQVVPHSTEQHVHVQLLQILEKAEAPDYLFKEITEWASKSQALGYNFRPRLTTKKAVINDLQQHLNMQNLRPTVSELKLEAIHELVPVVSFDFKTMLTTMLTDEKLMQPENLVINPAVINDDGKIMDASPWFAPYDFSSQPGIDEVLSGRWYKETVLSLSEENVFVCPLIFYVDKTFIDPIKSRFNLEPFSFTLAIFNRLCRGQFDFWSTLGHIPEFPDADEKTTSAGCKARNHHILLKSLLRGVIEVQQNPSNFNHFPLRIGNFVKYVNMRFPVAFIIGDTQGADKLCGRYLNYTDKVQRLHRSCMCKPVNATDTTNGCFWVNMDDMMDVIDRGDKEELRQYSQQRLPLHAFREINFGANRHGIYGATPNDVLHGIKLGLINYMLEIFVDEETSTASHHFFEQAWKATHVHLKQGGKNGYPRLYFPNGITTLTTTTADECLGIMFATYILCCTSQGRTALSTNGTISIARLNLACTAFERLLLFHAWLSHKKHYWKLEDARSMRRATKAIQTMMKFLCDNFTRVSNQGWNISKMHELLHVTKLIDMFGSPMNFDSGPGERMHKDVAKKPGRQSQKHHSTFTLQAANRLADRYVIDVSYNKMIFTNESPTNKTSSKSIGSSFILNIQLDAEASRYKVIVNGCGALSSQDLSKELYPSMVEYIVFYFSRFETMPSQIKCCTEFTDEDDTLYRAHHNFRGVGCWHDWAMAAYANDSEQGFSNVPVKLLCFLPNGIPGNNECHAVCHACQWLEKRETSLLTKWNLVPCVNAIANGIPYDIVPASSLVCLTLIIPDTCLPGIVYKVLPSNEWYDKFVD